MTTTPASRQELLNRLAAGAKFKYELFWHGPLSQWAASPFTINGITYPTTEHWMMASKARVFDDQSTLHAILAAKTPREAKALGAAVQGYNEDVWAAVRRDFVVYGNIAKFDADLELRRMLLNTGNAVLVEASPNDADLGNRPGGGG
jgi:ribA/ribD-fused uncharacterized protein